MRVTPADFDSLWMINMRVTTNDFDSLLVSFLGFLLLFSGLITAIVKIFAVFTEVPQRFLAKTWVCPVIHTYIIDPLIHVVS